MEQGFKYQPISKAGQHFEWKFSLKRDPHLETYIGMYPPKYTQVPASYFPSDNSKLSNSIVGWS